MSPIDRLDLGEAIGRKAIIDDARPLRDQVDEQRALRLRHGGGFHLLFHC